MTITNENAPILVAPRPVRIASEPGSGASFFARSTTPFRQLVSSVADHFERVRINSSADGDREETASNRVKSASPDTDLSSPRSSPRSSLPSEALEEFLSILRPSAFFPPSSPVLRARRNGASLPTYPYYFKARVLHSKGDSMGVLEETDLARPSHSPEYVIERNANSGEYESEPQLRWFSGSNHKLSSPVSRMHTRNPFQRHLTQDSAPKSTTPSPLSPTAVPLPSPTPDELI